MEIRHYASLFDSAVRYTYVRLRQAHADPWRLCFNSQPACADALTSPSVLASIKSFFDPPTLPFALVAMTTNFRIGFSHRKRGECGLVKSQFSPNPTSLHTTSTS